MTGQMTPESYPWWVKLTLLSARTRRAMTFYFVASVALGVALVVVGLLANSMYYVLLGLIGAPLSALAYGMSMRWIDAHGSWAAVAKR